MYSGGNDGTKGIIVKVTEVATGTNTYTSAYLTGTGDNSFAFNFTAPNNGVYKVSIQARMSTGTNHNFNNNEFFKVDNITVTHQEITNDLVCTSYSDYRYGFNNFEKDDEIKGGGNSYDYINRFYDTRLGRFLSVDPLTSDFPFYSPYQFAGNKPIVAIDLDGLEEFIEITGVEEQVNGIVLVRVAKSYYIKQLNDATAEQKMYLQQSLEAIENKSGRYANMSGKERKEAKAKIKGRIENLPVAHQAYLKQIDSDYSKTKYVESKGSVNQNNFSTYINKQGEMKDAMTDNEMEYFNGGGELMSKLGGGNAWKYFLEADIGSSAIFGDNNFIGYHAESLFETQTHFESASSTLVIEDQTYLDDIVSFMNAFTKAKITITGYTDSDGSEEANQQLSQDRAQSAMDYLVGQGIDASRISVEGKGESNAIQDSPTDEQKAQDRKITISVSTN